MLKINRVVIMLGLFAQQLQCALETVVTFENLLLCTCIALCEVLLTRVI